MLLHFYRARSGSATPPAGARFGATTVVTENAVLVTSNTAVLGDASDVLTITVVTYNTNNINSVFKINGVVKHLGDTATITLDGTGNGSMGTYLQGGLASGNATFVQLQITAATGANGIGSPSTVGYDKIV